MREIKFRGYFKSTNGPSGWKYGFLEIDNAGDCWIRKGSFCWKVEKESVGQYTGLKDKNGKEIFEEDIVKGDWYFEEPVEFKYEPRWLHEMLEYGLDESNLEILGNKYEHSHLITNHLK